MKVRVLVEMDDGGRGVRGVNVIDAALHAYNEKLRLAEPSAEIDFEVLGVVSEEPRDRDPRQRAEYLAASRAEAAMGDWRPKKEPSTHDDQCEVNDPEYMTSACRCDERALNESGENDD